MTQDRAQEAYHAMVKASNLLTVEYRDDPSDDLANTLFLLQEAMAGAYQQHRRNQERDKQARRGRSVRDVLQK